MLMALTLFAASIGQAEPASVTAVRDSYPNVSADGRRLVFHSNRIGRQALWIANVDGSDARILFDDATAGTDPGTPVWSPDGRRIAFAMRPSGAADPESDVYLIDSDGTNLRRLTDAPGDDSHPRWTADGRRIFFNSARATPDLTAPWSRQWIDIYSIGADGSDVRRHTECRSICTYPMPSPDGRHVAHRRVVESLGQNWDLSPTTRNSEVFVTPLDGGEPVNVSQSPAYDGWPTWSPDGRWVVFASNRDRIAFTGQIYAVSPSGQGLRRLTAGPLSRAQPSFHPAGDRIFVYESFETDAYEFGHIASFPVQLQP